MTNAFGWLPAVCEGSYVRDPVGHDDTALALLESSQFGQVMQVLGAELIPGAELALLRRGQAGDRAPADRPRGEGSRRVVEVRAAEALLPTVAILAELHRVQIYPTVIRCAHLDTDRQPVCFRQVAQRGQDVQAAVEVIGLDRQVEIAVRPGQPADQRSHAPAPADPMTHSRLVEPVQDIEHVRSPHAVSLGQRPADGPGLTWV